jgi:hypothetical protein
MAVVGSPLAFTVALRVTPETEIADELVTAVGAAKVLKLRVLPVIVVEPLYAFCAAIA